MDVRKQNPAIYGSFIETHQSRWNQQIEALRTQFGAAILAVRMPPGDFCEVPILLVKKERLFEVLSTLKSSDAFGYDFLSDMTATDEQEEGFEHRFELVYNLFSTKNFSRIRIKCPLVEGEEAPSIVTLWKGADWLEREVFDMFGVRFAGHPDLRRILMDDRFQGHPLRKDYPLRGYQLFVEPMQPEKTVLEAQ